MKLNFNNVHNELIKILLRKKRKELIITGSFALYKIIYPNSYLNQNETIKIKDLDFDLQKILEKYKENKEENSKKLIEILKKDYISKLFEELIRYDNVEEFNILTEDERLNIRKWNKDTQGLKFKLEIIDTNGQEYNVNFDVNFENKEFDILNKKITLDEEKLEANVYEEHKLLADKYISILKRLYLINKNQNDDKNINANIRKMSKDLFDINFINKRIKEVNINKLNKNFDLMLMEKDREKIKDVLKWTNKLILKHPEINLNRGEKYNIKFEIFDFCKCLDDVESKLE